MLNKVKETLKKYSMLKKGAKVLLCVSGGPDSVAMLSAFHSLKNSMGLKLFVCHLNHKLRGKDSDKDEEYVRQLSKRYKLPIITGQEDVKAFAKSNRFSLEDAARKVRYNFFLKAAGQLGADTIATAHTKDDQAETVLMRILRGTGLRGLRGISPVTKLSGFTLIRPLIDVSRKEVESYLKKRKIKARLDNSNLESKFFRNKIRLKLLPLLEKEYSPKIKQLLPVLAELLDKDYQYLNRRQEKAFKKLAKIGKENAAFSLAAFKRQPLSAQRALARKAIESLKGSLERIEYRHWQEIEELIYKRPVGSIVHLPGGTEAIKTKTTLKFCRTCPPKPKRGDIGSVVVKIPGITRFGRKIIRARIVKKPRRIKSHPKTEEYFDMERLDLPLTLRLRRPGDRIKPLGMRGYKKIKNIFIDEKVPLRRRNNIPLVVSSSNEILWLCGIKMSDKCKISNYTKRILKLKLL